MVRIILILCFALTAMGCGTVVRGTKQGVRFESDPAGAAVTVARAKKRKTEWHCNSPCELQLSRKRDFDVTFELAGYKPAKARLASRIGAKGGATAIPGNFVLGGGVGFIVDAGTGANMQLKPDPMRAKLARVGSSEDSVVYDVREEGGGIEDVHASDDEALGTSTLKPLSRDFGAEGSSITKASIQASGMKDPHGVLITTVDPEGAAARSGLEPGDVVQSINASRVNEMDDIQAAIRNLPSGQPAMLTVWRKGALYEATLVF